MDLELRAQRFVPEPVNRWLEGWSLKAPGFADRIRLTQVVVGLGSSLPLGAAAASQNPLVMGLSMAAVAAAEIAGNILTMRNEQNK